MMKVSLILLSISTALLMNTSTSTFTKAELLGQIDPTSSEDFAKIAQRYSDKKSIFMRKKAYEAFQQMHYDANAQGINLTIISAMRTFGHQRSIWDRKWARDRYQGLSDKEKALDILLYSSMPGTSRHHWGTDIDLNALNNEHFGTGAGKKVYDWLQDCGPSYGFYQTYTDKAGGRTGYEEEKWHWTYLPLSKEMLSAYLTQITYADITGFKGSSLAEEIGMIPNYVEGVEIVDTSKQ